MNERSAVGQQDTAQSHDCSEGLGLTSSLQRQVAKEFSRALRRAKNAAASGKSELAVGWCHYAALLAWGANPGFFYSHEVEQLLGEIGKTHLGPGPVAAPCAGHPRRFLHLMSTAYGTGGHTRVVSRWIEICAKHAPAERHSILISMQKDDPLPAWLSTSVERAGGTIFVLPSKLSWLQAAAEIRSRAFEFDVVILHIHPNDPLPNLAFYDQPRPILFFRHADHVFNLGLDVARVVTDICPAGHEMSMRFCAQASRKAMLPLPLMEEEPPPCDKAKAREKLGLPADALIVLTIGGSNKYLPIPGYSFREVVHALCETNSRIQIVAVGLTESEPFPGLGASVGGRFLPVGVVNDRNLLELYYRAADVYSDAYPCSSLTAVLDAARHGLPLRRLRNSLRCLMWGDDPALDSVMLGAPTQEEFIATTVEWLEWPEEKRSELGTRFREAVLRDHCGASWKSTWLDPAINALFSPSENFADSNHNWSQRDGSSFPGLGLAGPESDWPSGMFIAGAILSSESVPHPIRVSGALRSIRPALFGPIGNSARRKRLFMLGLLIASLMPIQVRIAMRRVWRAIYRTR